MNTLTRHAKLEAVTPTLMIDELKGNSFGTFGIDNAVADFLKELNLATILTQVGCSKRSGMSIVTLLTLMVIRPMLQVSSIFMFSRDHHLSVFKIGKDSFYRILQTTIPWQRILQQMISKIILLWLKEDLGETYLAADTTFHGKRGKEIEGVCYHHNHTTGKTEAGFETTQLIWVTQKGSLVLSALLRLSKKPLITNLLSKLTARFDARSLFGKSFKESAYNTKLEHTLTMVENAIACGVTSKYFLADAWFDSPQFIADIRTAGLIPIIRMKRGGTKFGYNNKEYDVKELWSSFAKAKCRKVNKSLRFRGTHLDVSHPKLGIVRLFFMRLINPETGSKEWAVFITTDTSMTITSMIEHYSHRFAIEVFYKESKQYLGFMKESVRSFEAVTACLQIATMRHAIMSSLTVLKGLKREEVSQSITALTYAQKLWNAFKHIITDAIMALDQICDEAKSTILQTINDSINQYLCAALLMDNIGCLRQIHCEMNCET